LKEQYEMQYNYFHLDKIQGEDKLITEQVIGEPSQAKTAGK
jgi:hypothetical protein